MNARARGLAGLSRKPLFRVGLILAAALVGGFLARPEGQRANDGRRSLFRTTPDGVAALARGIERLGRRTEGRLTPLVDSDPVRGTIMLLRPPLPLTPREVNALLNRVRDGGTVIYAPPYIPAPDRVGQTPLMDTLGIGFRFRTARDEVLEQRLDAPRWGDHPLTRGLPEAPEPVHGLRVANLGEREPQGEGVEEEEGARGPAAAEALLTASDEAGGEWMAAALLRLGEGRLVLLSESGPLSNENAADHPLAVLAVRAALLWTSEADTVFFAEYHQGIRGQRSRAEILSEFFLDTTGGRFILHLIAVGFLVLACAGLRFGAPAPAVAPPDRERRSPLEHVSALGDLYRKAGAAETAALLLVTRLARATRNPPPRDVTQAQALLQRLDTDPGADTPLYRARQGLRADPSDLTAIADAIDEHLARRFNT